MMSCLTLYRMCFLLCAQSIMRVMPSHMIVLAYSHTSHLLWQMGMYMLLVMLRCCHVCHVVMCHIRAGHA